MNIVYNKYSLDLEMLYRIWIIEQTANLVQSKINTLHPADPSNTICIWT